MLKTKSRASFDSSLVRRCNAVITNLMATTRRDEMSVVRGEELSEVAFLKGS